MKTAIAIHRTNEKPDATSKRQVTLYISNGTDTDVITGAQFDAWRKTLKKPIALRFTAVHANDPLLTALIADGHTIQYANWHATGIEKNLPPQEIAEKYALLPLSAFRTFTPRPDLGELRMRVSQYLAITEYRKSAILKLRACSTLCGQVDEDEISDSIKTLLKEAEEINLKVPVTKNGKTKEVSLTTAISHLAKAIPECRFFNAAACIADSWITAAIVVGFSGGIDRFDQVSSFWHYCGEHVVDGRAPGRKKGQAITWSPRLRTALWQMSDSLIKNRNNPWRQFYEQELAKELAAHAQKHPDCKTVQGHCGAMARRKMRKEILKRFFVACKGQEFRQDSGSRRENENQPTIAAA